MRHDLGDATVLEVTGLASMRRPCLSAYETLSIIDGYYGTRDERARVASQMKHIGIQRVCLEKAPPRHARTAPPGWRRRAPYRPSVRAKPQWR